MSAPLRLVHDLPGRGRAYVSARTILPGELLLSDLPLLLYSPSPPSLHCSHCFRPLPPTPHHCPTCLSPFCSPSCHSLSLSTSHAPWLCHSLVRLPSHLHSSDLRFLLSAYSLASTFPSSFSALLSLHGSALPDPDSERLHSIVSSLSPPSSPFPFSPSLTSSLLAKDRQNSFGLMDAPGGAVRAYGIYLNAAFFNHDCLPNACRFDYLDGSPAGEIYVRAIHEIPKGREVCLSYFPVNWGFKERQERLREEYGFKCQCDRCEVEKNWKEDEDDGESMGEDGMEEEDGDGGDFPHAYFFLKFQCRRDGCGGTLAPLPPSPEGVVSDRMECNACGCITKDDDDDEEEEEEEEDEEGEGSAMLDD